jgi:hypothetical protein
MERMSCAAAIPPASECESEESRAKSIEQHQFQAIFSLRSKRDADADFGRAPGDDVGKHAEQTYASQGVQDSSAGWPACWFLATILGKMS